MIIILTAIVLSLNVATAIVIIAMIAFDSRMKVFPISHKLGLWFGPAGLIYHAIYNVKFISTGERSIELANAGLLLLSACLWLIMVAVLLVYFKRQKSRKKEFANG